MMFKSKILFNEAPNGNPGGAPPVAPPADPLFQAPPVAPPVGGAPPVAPPGTPPPPSVVIPENWKESLPAEFKDVPWLKNVTDVSTLVKNMANAQKLIGADKIPVPGASATPEEWAGVFKKLGLPETVDKYTFELDKSTEVDPEFLGNFKKTAHQQGILPNQAKAMMEWFSSANKESWQKVQTERESQVTQGINSLKTEWGQAYEQNIVYAKAALKEFAPTEAEQAHLRSIGVGRDPVMLKFLMNAGKTLAEDKIKGAGGVGGTAARSPAEALTEIKEMQSNKAHPYLNANHPEHQKAKRDMTLLFQMAYPTPKTS